MSEKVRSSSHENETMKNVITVMSLETFTSVAGAAEHALVSLRLILVG